MSISIHSDFDGGNIDVTSIKGGSAKLAIRRDKDSDFYQWFYFRVDGAAGQMLELSITNCGGSAYPLGWPDYRACVSNDDNDWLRADTSYSDGVLTIRHTPDADSVWFAYFAPYTMDRHAALIERIAAVPHVGHRELGKTLDGRALDLLVSNETVAAQLREAATFYVVPNMNPDGSARGHLRTNSVGVNLNREWATPTPERSAEVLHVRNAMDETGVDFSMDVHGDEAIPYAFMAGFHGIPAWTQRQGDLYDKYLKRLAAQTRDFQTQFGYPKAADGKANLSMSTNQLAERFGAVSMTLEMPFKDNANAPDALRGWSAERSRHLARDCLIALAGMIDEI